MGEREAQLRAARRYEETVNFVEWLESPGLSCCPRKICQDAQAMLG